MADSEGVRYHDQATTWLACLCGNEGFDTRHVVNGCDNRLHAEGSSGGSEWAQKTFDEGRRWRIEQQRHPGDPRRNLLKQFYPLATQRPHDGCETSRIAAWPR